MFIFMQVLFFFFYNIVLLFHMFFLIKGFYFLFINIGNMFLLNFEVGLYKKFDIDDVAFRATGCEGIDDISISDTKHIGDSWLSPVANCPVQDDKDKNDTPIHEIVEEFADNHDIWASHFLQAWKRMQSIGYTDLKDGPEESWLGYYTLKDMGANIGNIH